MTLNAATTAARPMIIQIIRASPSLHAGRGCDRNSRITARPCGLRVTLRVSKSDMEICGIVVARVSRPEADSLKKQLNLVLDVAKA